MPHSLRIDQLTREEKREIQVNLIRLGFLDPVLPSGDDADDGIWGPVTDRAYSQYWATRPVEISIPVVAPAPDEPWWVSGTHWSLLGVVLSGLLGLAGWQFDAGDLAVVLSMAATTIGGVIGLYRNGRRKQPIDRTLVARVGSRDVRWPGGLRDHGVPADADARRGFFWE